MVLRLITLALAQALDLVTFRVMVQLHGPGCRGEPARRRRLRINGLGALVGRRSPSSCSSLPSPSPAMIRSAVPRGVVGGVPMAMAIAIGLVGGITNAATILHRRADPPFTRA